MLPILLTAFGLVVLVSAMLLLRSRWPGLSPQTRRTALTLAFLFISILVAAYITTWATVSVRFNCAVCWGAAAGYLLLLTIFSLNRPRALTSLLAVILALPLFSSSLFLPLGGLFKSHPRRTAPLGDHLYVAWQPFIDGSGFGTGVDVDIFQQSRLIPWLHRSRLGGHFFDTHCHGAATDMHLLPDHKNAYVHCPPWPGSVDAEPALVLPLH